MRLLNHTQLSLPNCWTTQEKHLCTLPTSYNKKSKYQGQAVMLQAVDHMHFERTFEVTILEVTAGVKRARGRALKSKKNFLEDF